MRPGKSPSSKRMTEKRRLQNSPVLQPLLLFCPIIFASCVIYARKRKGFRACGRDQRAFRSPFGNLRPPVPCGNPCKLSSERIHLHHAGTKKHAFFLRRFPRTAAKAPISTGTPRCFSGERERGFSQKSRLSPRNRFLTRGWQSRSSSAPCATSYWRDRRPSPRWY